MKFRLFSIKKLFETKPFPVENAVSKQIYNSSLSREELINSFRSDIYSSIQSASFYGSEKHFVALPYPYYLDSEDISSIVSDIEGDGYRVKIDSELGCFIVSWNHCYHI